MCDFLFSGKVWVPKQKPMDPVLESVTLEPELEEALANATDAELCDIAGRRPSRSFRYLPEAFLIHLQGVLCGSFLNEHPCQFSKGLEEAKRVIVHDPKPETTSPRLIPSQRVMEVAQEGTMWWPFPSYLHQLLLSPVPGKSEQTGLPAPSVREAHGGLRATSSDLPSISEHKAGWETGTPPGQVSGQGSSF